MNNSESPNRATKFETEDSWIERQRLRARTVRIRPSLRVGFYIAALTGPFFAAIVLLPLNRIGNAFSAPPIRLLLWTFGHAMLLRAV